MGYKIFNDCEVQTENSVTRITVQHQQACRVMPNGYTEWWNFKLTLNNHYKILFLAYSASDNCIWAWIGVLNLQSRNVRFATYQHSHKKYGGKWHKTSSPKGNDRSPESNVPRSNLISKTYKWAMETRAPKIELVQAFMPVLVTSNFDDDSIKNEWASMETPFSHYKPMWNFLDLKGS